ncbi:MAG: hypothetical protein EZS28_031302 [Streblomastix strix]|uniref:Tyr recombinase domain-containing protein n=1 Tax=Streblomastix strix TaxID=222440 RepID=A0A5J4USW0_9EUKA|nr:MAG: hypothetical protein EZS28_031302 [Streblomastix strix]
MYNAIMKIHNDGVILASVMAPNWPYQYWYSELKEITINKVSLGRSEDVPEMGIYQKNLGQALPSGNIYHHKVSIRKESSYFENLNRQWRRHAIALINLATQVRKCNMQPEQQLYFTDPQMFMANQLDITIIHKESPSAINAQRRSLPLLLRQMDNNEQLVQSHLVAQLIRPILILTRKKEIEQEIWYLNLLINYIKSQKETADQKKLNAEALRAILGRHQQNEKNIDADDLFKSIRSIIRAAGIDKKFSFTSIRAAVITELLNKGHSAVIVDRFFRHSDTASTIRQLLKVLRTMRSTQRFSDMITQRKNYQTNQFEYRIQKPESK